MNETTEYTNIDLEREIKKIKNVKEKYEVLIADLKKQQAEYKELIKILRDIKDGLLKGKLNEKQIKAFKKICE